MPAHILPYIVGLIQAVHVSATFIERQFGFSHDRITRSLTKKVPWEQIIILVIQRLFGLLSGGYLIIDDTVIAKPYAKKMQEASVVYSSLLKKTIYGYSVVLLCWSNGTITIPLAWRWYKANDKSRIDLAMELLTLAKEKWQFTPKYVLFDSFYAANRILNLIESYQWQFVTRLKNNRIMSCAPIREDLTDDGDTLTGLITKEVKVTIVKHDNKYFCTNHFGLSLIEILSIYQYRWPIEEVFRFLKSELRLEKCQARTIEAQKTHLVSCVLVYLLLQKEQQRKQNQTLYAIRRDWQADRRLGRNRINHYVKVLTA